MNEEPVNIRRFDLTAEGLARVVGELEAQILEVLWQECRGAVGDVAAELDNDVHYKTVMTVMNRMCEKGLLRRNRHGRAYHYTPTFGRERFFAGVVEQVISGLAADFGRPTLAHFVSHASDEEIAELYTLLEERRNDGG